MGGWACVRTGGALSLERIRPCGPSDGGMRERLNVWGLPAASG